MAPLRSGAAVREQGGVVGVAHPFDRFRQGAGRKGWEEELERVIPLLDYVEAWNARIMVGDGNTRAAEYAKIHDLPGTRFVRRAHGHGSRRGVHDPRRAMDTAEEFRAALAAGPKLVTAHGSRLIRLGMPFAKLVQRAARQPAHERLMSGTDDRGRPSTTRIGRSGDNRRGPRLPARPRGKRAAAAALAPAAQPAHDHLDRPAAASSSCSSCRSSRTSTSTSCRP